MRYLIATLAVTLLSTAAAPSVQANHRLTDLAAAYHESVHVLADYTARDRHASQYLSRYLHRLDEVADGFVHSLEHDPYGARTRALFGEVQSLHHRIESLVGHGCRSFPALRSVWNDADRSFAHLEYSITELQHRGPAPRYNLDRQRVERREINSRNLNRRDRGLQGSVQVNATHPTIGRLLSGLLN